MDWGDFKFLQVGQCTGTLEFQDSALDVAFTVDWSNRRRITLELEPLPVTEEALRLFDRLYHGEEGDRRVPYCTIAAQTQDGRELRSDFASVSSCTEGNFIKVKLELGHIEIRSLEIVTAESTNEQLSVEYFNKGQLGFRRPSVTHDLGEVWLRGATRIESDSQVYTGVVGIDGSAAGRSVSSEQWLEDGNQLATRVLQMLSLAHGRQFFWELRKVFCGEELYSVTVRPQEDPVNMRVAVFHHLDLQPVLELAVSSFTEELDEGTGLGIALSWFLAVTRNSESQFMHMMTALEHLVHVFSQTSPSAAVVPRSFFRDRIRSKLNRALQELIGEQTGSGQFSEQQASEISRGIGNANRRSFRSRLEEMLDSYGVVYDDLSGELTSLIQMRNVVAHRGLFPSNEVDESGREVERCRNIAEELLVRIFLTLLDYNGRYNSPLYNLDWRPLPRRENQVD